MMNPEIKARWVAALRSGKYQQGRRVLRNGDSYCCLGVLCELALEDGIVTATIDEHTSVTRYHDVDRSHNEFSDEHDSTHLLSLGVRDWANLGLNPSVSSGGGRTHTLSGFNDEGTSFADIADMIEERL